VNVRDIGSPIKKTGRKGVDVRHKVGHGDYLEH
jgi:hypothetical protein